MLLQQTLPLQLINVFDDSTLACSQFPLVGMRLAYIGHHSMRWPCWLADCHECCRSITALPHMRRRPLGAEREEKSACVDEVLRSNCKETTTESGASISEKRPKSEIQVSPPGPDIAIEMRARRHGFLRVPGRFVGKNGR